MIQRSGMIGVRLTSALNALLKLLSPPGSTHALTSANSPGGAVKAGQNLALALLVLGVLADDANDAAAVNYLALVADLFY
jgi:hypothetical protein